MFITSETQTEFSDRPPLQWWRPSGNGDSTNSSGPTSGSPFLSWGLRCKSTHFYEARQGFEFNYHDFNFSEGAFRGDFGPLFRGREAERDGAATEPAKR